MFDSFRNDHFEQRLAILKNKKKIAEDKKVDLVQHSRSFIASRILESLEESSDLCSPSRVKIFDEVYRNAQITNLEDFVSQVLPDLRIFNIEFEKSKYEYQGRPQDYWIFEVEIV